MKRADYLIVGQGIVGSVMAFALMQKGRSVVVIDEPRLSASSRVAAGAYNPFNFRRMINNWKADEMVESAERLYSSAETSLQAQFFFRRKIYKVFSGENERQLWEKSCAEHTGLFADPQIMENPFPGVIAPHGIGVVHHAGNIDTAAFFFALSAKLKSERNFFEEKFNPSLLELTSSGAIYDKRIEAGRVIFCEGYLVRDNPWFNFLPVFPVKGQVLHVYIPGLQLNEIMNRGAYLLPLGNERFILGSSFENEQDDETITPEIKDELLQRLEKFITLPVQVESQFAGVRPAVSDRRPIIGRHPQYPQLAVFNGMGSKAVFLSPWLSERLVEYLEEGKEIAEEVRMDRFKEK